MTQTGSQSKPALTRCGTTVSLHYRYLTKAGIFEASPFGTRYVIEGIISTPDGRAPFIRAVWFIETGEQIPRFVTAYPLQRREE
jgi:hypothetical protein